MIIVFIVSDTRLAFHDKLAQEVYRRSIDEHWLEKIERYCLAAKTKRSSKPQDAISTS